MNNRQVHQITLQCTSVCVEVEPARRNDGGIVKADSIYWTRVKFGETISIQSNHLPCPPFSTCLHWKHWTLELSQFGSNLKVIKVLNKMFVRSRWWLWGRSEKQSEKNDLDSGTLGHWDSGTLGHQTVTSWEFSFLPPLSFSSRTSLIIITTTMKM